MTNIEAKEKAVEIVEMYRLMQVNMTGRLNYEFCIQCAILQVKAIIAISPSKPIISDNGSYSSDIKESTAYFIEILSELEKM